MKVKSAVIITILIMIMSTTVILCSTNNSESSATSIVISNIDLNGNGENNDSLAIDEAGVIQSITIDDTTKGDVVYGDTSTYYKVVLPSAVSYDGKEITITGFIASSAVFQGTSATALKTILSIELPDTISNIPEKGCKWCGITSIEIPSSVKTIGASAFYACISLKSIEIPSSVITINKSTFYGCTALKSIEIPSSVETISETAFKGCTSLEQFDGSQCSQLKTIGNYAFSGCTSLSSIDLGNNALDSVGLQAFSGCSALKSISISSKSYANQLFMGCSSLKTVLFGSDTVLLDSPINNGAFYGCKSLESVTVHGSLSVGSYTFQGTSLKTLSVSGYLQYIGNCAFYGCNYLSDLNDGSGGSLKISGNIGSYAFYNCTLVKKIQMVGGTSIGDYAFHSCTSLNEIILPASLTTFGSHVLEGCSSLTSIEIDPSNVTFITSGCMLISADGKTVIASASGMSGSLTIPEGVEEISAYAFFESSISSVTFSSTLKVIGVNSFSGSALISVSIPKSVESIDVTAFSNCGMLSKLTVESGNSMYSAYSGLLIDNANKVIFAIPTVSAVIIPSYVTAIGDNAFSGSSITSLTYVNTDSSSTLIIGQYAFYSCPSLKEVLLDSDGKIIINRSAFYQDNRLSKVIIDCPDIEVYAAITSCGDIVINLGDEGTLRISGNNPFGGDSLVINGGSGATISFGNYVITSVTLCCSLDPSQFESKITTKTIVYTGTYTSFTNVNITFGGIYKLDLSDYTVTYYDYFDGKVVSFEGLNGISLDSDYEGYGISDSILTFKISVDASLTELTAYDLYVTVNGDEAVLSSDDCIYTYTVDSASELNIAVSEKTGTNYVTISFDTGMDYVSCSDLVVLYGRTISYSQLPSITDVSGYTFEGWYYDEAFTTEYDKEPIYGNLTLYAKWSGDGTSRLFIDLSSNGEITAKIEDSDFVSGSKFISDVILEYSLASNYEFIGWKVTTLSGDVYMYTEDSLTLVYSEYSTDVTVSLCTRYYSSSNTVTPVIDTNTPLPDEDLILLWSFYSSETSMGMNDTWSMPSVPLIVDDYLYTYVGDTLYMIDVETGKVIKEVNISSLSDFYRYLGYGGGYIIEYNSGTIYDLELNEVCSIDIDISSSFYYDGYFYGIFSDVEGKVLKKFSIVNTDSTYSVQYSEVSGWEDGIDVEWYDNTYGTTSSPVFVDTYMYFISSSSSSSNWTISICSINLDDGTMVEYELDTLTGRYLDDGWLTYDSGYIYITSYVTGLFDSTNTSTSWITVIELGDSGTFDSYFNIDLGYYGIASQFVIYNGRGYVNVNNSSSTEGVLLVYDIKEILDGDDTYGLIYKETTTGTHGSIVVDTYYSDSVDGKTDLVYIYILPYSSSQKIYIIEDYDEKTSASGAYISESLISGYGSQAIRTTEDGKLIWYNDSGNVLCYARASDYPYYFIIEDDSELKIISGIGDNVKEALKNALDDAGITYSMTYSGILTTLDGKEGWEIYYYSEDESAFKSGTLYDTSISSRVFYISSTIDSENDIDIDVAWYQPSSEGCTEYTLSELATDSKEYVGESYCSYEQWIVKYDLSGGTGMVSSNIYSEGEVIITSTYDGTKVGYIFGGWYDGNTITAAGDPYTVGSSNVTFIAVWISSSNPVTSIVLDQTTLSMQTGDQITLNAKVLPGNALNKEVAWSSSDDSIATVDENGVVKALSKGTVTITVTSVGEYVSNSCIITIVAKSVTSVTLDKSTLSLSNGSTSTLTATVSPTDAGDTSVSWASSNTAVATVDSSGKVSAWSVGTAVITVTTVDGSKTATCTVTVTAVVVSSVVLDITSKSLDVGKTVLLTATVKPDNAANKNLIWMSSDASVATVDSNGVVTAVKAGSAVITVKTADQSKTATCSITVNPTVTSIVLDDQSVAVEVSSSVTLIVQTSISGTSISWSSSDTSVATVDSSGKVTGISPGTAVITASYKEVTATCTVVVSKVYDPVDKGTVTNSDGTKTNTVEQKIETGESTITKTTVKTTDKDGKTTGIETTFVAVDDDSKVTTEVLIKTDSSGNVTVSASTIVSSSESVSNGKQTVTISKDDISKAVEQIISINGLSDQDLESVIVIGSADSNDSVGKMVATLSVESIKEIAESTSSEICIVSDLGTLEISNEVLDTLSDGSGNVQIGIGQVSDSELTDAQKEEVGDSTVFSLTATVGDESIHELGGDVTVTLPYELKSGQDPNNVKVYYLNDYNELEEIACTYDSTNKTVSFVTDHFSNYLLHYGSLTGSSLTASDSDNEVSMLLIVVIILLVALIVMMAVWMYMVHKGLSLIHI